MSEAPLLAVEDLAVEFHLRDCIVRAVDGVSFAIAPREFVGLVGESGSGKSITLLSILRLVPPPGRVSTGRVVFGGRDLLSLDRATMRQIRGNQIALIPADAAASLNPVTRVGDQVLDGIHSHQPSTPPGEARQRMLDMFRRVGLPLPEMRARRYPHELSGGMQQRALIASALVLGPDLILADEPTTALDVTVGAQILRLLLSVRDQFGSAVVFVTHDLASVAEICDRVLVMYAGRIVEAAPVRELFARPAHPYTRALIASVPPLRRERPAALKTIAGAPPDPRAWPPGCRFAERCELRAELGDPERCTGEDPGLRPVASGHAVACHFAETQLQASESNP